MVSAFKCSHALKIWRQGKLVDDVFILGASENGNDGFRVPSKYFR